MNGLSNGPQLQDGSIEIIEGVYSLEDGEVDIHNCDVSNRSFTILVEKGPETPMLELGLLVQCDAIEVMLPFDEELVEAQISLNVGKALGLR